MGQSLNLVDIVSKQQATLWFFIPQAVGLAVLTSDLIGRTELVVGQGLGIAVAPTVEGHLGGVRRLMADRAAVAAMGARGRALVVERYSWEAFEGKFVDFYARLCSAGRRG